MDSDETRNVNISKDPEEFFFERLAELAEPGEEKLRAPSRLKSKIYSSLVRRMEESGPILGVEPTCETHRLCVFEGLIQIAPLPESVGSVNFCKFCHARVLAERFERAPIYWSGCPYAAFQDR